MNDWPHWTRSLLVISAFFWTVYTVAEATTPSSTISGPRGWLSAAQEQQLGGQPLPQHFRAEEAKGQAVQENGCHCGYTAAKLLLSGLVLVLSAFAAGWHLGGRNVSRDAASSAIEGQSPASAAAHSELQGENLIARFQEVASPAEAGKSGDQVVLSIVNFFYQCHLNVILKFLRQLQDQAVLLKQQLSMKLQLVLKQIERWTAQRMPLLNCRVLLRLQCQSTQPGAFNHKQQLQSLCM